MLLRWFGEKIHFLRDATRGGIASVLNEIAKDGNMGIDIQEKNIPLNEQVNGACEMLGLDPLYVANEGVFIAIIDATIQNEVMQLLTEDDNCKNAKVIGIDAQIIELLDKYVKPAVEMDGGNIAFKSFDNGIVTLIMQGACSGCPSSSATLKDGIEAMLKRMIPQVTEVVAEAGWNIDNHWHPSYL